ncbi:unnamed protein product [Closterium sp. NIES-53]
MFSIRPVSGLPPSFRSLPPLLEPPYTPCIEGWLRATPHSSSLRPASAPFQTLHMDGITKSWTLPQASQQNGVAERRIGLFMEVARTSMIHARAPHFLWPYTVCYAAHQLNHWPCVSRPEGCLALIRDTSVDKLSACALHCVFLGFRVDAPGFTTRPSTGRPLPPPPTSPFPPPAPAPPTHPPHPGPARQPSALPRPVAVDSRSVGAGGTGAGGAGYGGVGAGGVSTGDAGAGGSGIGGVGSVGVGAGGASTKGANSDGVGAGGADTGGTSSDGVGAGGADAGGTSPGGARTRGTGAMVPTQPPHRYLTCHQALRPLEQEEQEQLEQE